MRTAIHLAIGAVCSFLWAGATDAYSLRLESRGPTSGLRASDTVAIDVMLEPNCTADYAESCETFGTLSVAVLFDPAQLSYDPAASMDLPLIHFSPGGGGAQPSYILYGHHAIMYPVVTPAFSLHPNPPPGRGQINLEYVESAGGLGRTFGWIEDVWIGSVVFHLGENAESTLIELSASVSGTGIRPDLDEPFIDPATIGLGSPVLVTIPEPLTALLLLVGATAAVILGATRRSPR